MSKQIDSKGFGLIATLAVVATVVIVGLIAWRVIVNHKDSHHTAANQSTSKQSSVSTHSSKVTRPTDPYAGWKTYIDTGYTDASAITIRYPATWQVKVGGSNSFAWQVIDSQNTKNSIGVRTTFPSAASTPRQEWTNCPSADACGPGPGSTTVSESDTMINGLSAYQAMLKDSTGAPYYVTVIKGTDQTSDGIAFDEFIIRNPSSEALATYNKIVGSAKFN
jgi:hypothetical protein